MIVVLGGGESGYGSAVLAKAKGFEVLLSDGGAIAPRYKEVLDKWAIPYEEGGHSMDKILQAAEVIKSPGIPDKAPVVKAVREAGIPVISEIEFAGRYTSARTIVITGSNGKTTTTTLIHKILADAGFDVGLAGNIGESLAYQVATADRAWYVLELSSFQLDGMFDFRADIAVLLNITSDHLDRYDYKFSNYIASKFRVIQNQGVGDVFIYSGDDPAIADHMPVGLDMKLRPFSVKDYAAAWLDGGIIRAGEFSIRAADLKIKGHHNVYNAMAATLAAQAAGVPEDSLRAALREFAGVEHRLEPVAVIEGVEWINDSKATNVDSVWYALQSMTRPVVWIAGGTDKGNDYAPLKDFVREKVRALVCLGADNSKLLQEFDGVAPVIIDTHSMEECVRQCALAVQPGDAVLLSPACASFDLFKNYEDRGRQFKEEVYKLKDRG
ncbi:MAG: UDP-N-acetylmuramoyl-L-alanine--D-glutamate ligase [Rikenellaceae bacterium]|jgi:UDP-N-acetylmuramoylalanine--D-glutamate ligase|nr:UDP-N-acetylmuramoyl-L-alanine--D-glutamate ligase [Rikenellaceae bacterium]